MRSVVCLSAFLISMTPALAQSALPTPLSGPNNPVPSPICALVNFGFCPQPAPPPPLYPDPNAAAAQPPSAPPSPHQHHHRAPVYNG